MHESLEMTHRGAFLVFLITKVKVTQRGVSDFILAAPFKALRVLSKNLSWLLLSSSRNRRTQTFSSARIYAIAWRFAWKIPTKIIKRQRECSECSLCRRYRSAST